MEKLRILAVDDEENVLQIIKNTFPYHDVTTETASLKALEIIKKETFDIFIADYQMPVVNGIEFLEEIKEEYGDRHYVSIFCTAYGTIYLFKEELNRGLFNFYIEKPFNVETLKSIMEKSILTLGRMLTGSIQPAAGS